MKTSACVILALCVGFQFTFFSPAVRAQQEDDDPNWRERSLERSLERLNKLNNDMEKLLKDIEENERERQRQRNELFQRLLKRPGSDTKSRLLDMYDYGPSRDL